MGDVVAAVKMANTMIAAVQADVDALIDGLGSIQRIFG